MATNLQLPSSISHVFSFVTNITNMLRATVTSFHMTIIMHDNNNSTGSQLQNNPCLYHRTPPRTPVVDEERRKQIFSGWGQCFEFPSVLQYCWLGDKKQGCDMWDSQLQGLKNWDSWLQSLNIPRLRLRVKVGHRFLNLCDCEYNVLSEQCWQTNPILLWGYLNLISVIS